MIVTKMDRTSISIVLVSILLQSITNGKDINFVFLVEPIQDDVTNDISQTFKDIRVQQYQTEIRNSILTVTDDKDADIQKLRRILADGFAVVIDFTYLPRSNDFEWMEQVLYIRVDLIISPVLRMFGEFLKEKGANDVALIFENDQDADEALYHIIRGFPFRVVIINAAETNFVRRLKSLRPCPSYVGVFAKGVNMEKIFTKIRSAKLFARPREWHFIFLDIMNKGFKFESQAEYATKFSLNAREMCQALEMDDRSCGSGFKFQKAVIFQIIRSVLSFLNTDDSLRAESYNSLNIAQVNIDFKATIGASQFLVMAEDRVTYNFNMSIKLFSNNNESLTDLAIWQAGELKKINATISPAKRFFRIGTVEAIPWSYLRRDQRTGKISRDQEDNPIWEGYCVDLIQTLSEYMNFEYELVPRMKGQFGRRHSNGSWDGAVGDLVTGETDFIVAALKMTAEREEVIDYIAPYFEQTGISIVIRKAVRQTSLFKFMTVLRLEVWLSIVAALIATAVMIWLLDKYSPYSARNNKKAYPYPCREFSLKESFWFALTSFTPQGGGEAPKAFSGRILVAAYWLFVVLMLATFTANLAAFLTVERMQAPVQSLEQLARQSRINYTVVEGSDTHKYFINMKYAEDTLYRMWKELSLNATSDQSRYRIWDYPIKEQYGHILLAINSSGPVKNATQGFQKVNEHGNADFAFIHDSAEIKYEITKNCNLTEVGEVFAEQPYAIAVQQGSHLSDEISYAILELQRDRYFEGLSAKYWNHSLNKECSRSEDQEGITLESLGGVFIATLFGLALAMITLAIEVAYYRKKEKQSINVASIREVIPVRTVSGATPPPYFEVATFRGRKIPKNITLGNEFKPIRTKKKQKINFSPQQAKDHPFYYE